MSSNWKHFAKKYWFLYSFVRIKGEQKQSRYTSFPRAESCSWVKEVCSESPLLALYILSSSLTSMYWHFSVRYRLLLADTDSRQPHYLEVTPSISHLLEYRDACTWKLTKTRKIYLKAIPLEGKLPVLITHYFTIRKIYVSHLNS